MSPKHTPAPWRVLAGDIQAQSVDEEWDLTICTYCDPDDAQRIVACVNACENINPAAIPQMVTLLLNLRTLMLRWGTDRHHPEVIDKMNEVIHRAMEEEK